MRESTLKYSISVIIPAHNEERYVARCIRSIRQAARYYGGRVEIIVVCNRCTDKTAEIAGRLGARVLHNQDRCIAKVRNTGIFAAKGDLIVTIDCDNRMTRGTLREIAAFMATGDYIGGGAPAAGAAREERLGVEAVDERRVQVVRRLRAEEICSGRSAPHLKRSAALWR